MDVLCYTSATIKTNREILAVIIANSQRILGLYFSIKIQNSEALRAFFGIGGSWHEKAINWQADQWHSNGKCCCSVGWSSIKVSSSQYKDSHYKDETTMRPSCHHDGNFYAGKKASFHWIGPLVTEKPSHIEADKNGWQKWTKTWGHFQFYFRARKVLDK